MTASVTKQGPPSHSHEFVAGNPYAFTVTSTGATLTSPVVTMTTASGDAYTTSPGIPGTVTQVGAVTTVGWNAAASAALNATTRAKVYKYSLQALVNGVGPYELVAKEIIVHPVGWSLPTQSGDPVNLEITIGGVDIALTIDLGLGADVAADLVANYVPYISTGRRVAALGDSIVSGIIGATTPNVNNVVQGSFLSYGCMMSGGRLEYAGTYGVVGDTSTETLARVDDVIAVAPNMCIIQCGANDSGITETQTNIPLIVAALREAGITPVVSTRPPTSSAYAGAVALHLLIRKTNQWLTRWAARNGVKCIDFFGVLADPATGLYRSGYNSDVTHPNQTGYRVMGQLVADELSEQVNAGVTWLTQDIHDDTNLVGDGLFTTGASVPTGWAAAAAGSGTVTSFVSTDVAFKGRAYNVAVVNAVTDVLRQTITAGSGTFSPGDTVAVSCLLSTTLIEESTAVVSISVENVGETSGATNVVSWQVGANILAGRIYYEAVVPPGTTSLVFDIRSDGGDGDDYSYRVGQVSLVSLTKLGLT